MVIVTGPLPPVAHPVRNKKAPQALAWRSLVNSGVIRMRKREE